MERKRYAQVASVVRLPDSTIRGQLKLPACLVPQAAVIRLVGVKTTLDEAYRVSFPWRKSSVVVSVIHEGACDQRKLPTTQAILLHTCKKIQTPLRSLLILLTR